MRHLSAQCDDDYCHDGKLGFVRRDQPVGRFGIGGGGLGLGGVVGWFPFVSGGLGRGGGVE